MHSRIYQVSSNPIKEENLIKENKYYEWGHADYVSLQESETDINSDLEWLKTATHGLEIDTQNKTIKILSKKEYFEERHEKFQELAEELSNTLLEDFSNGKINMKMYDLESYYEDKYGFYIDDSNEYCGLTSLDDWVRNAEENKIYYVGSIFDYHF